MHIGRWLIYRFLLFIACRPLCWQVLPLDTWQKPIHEEYAYVTPLRMKRSCLNNSLLDLSVTFNNENAPEVRYGASWSWLSCRQRLTLRVGLGYCPPYHQCQGQPSLVEISTKVILRMNSGHYPPNHLRLCQGASFMSILSVLRLHTWQRSTLREACSYNFTRVERE